MPGLPTLERLEPRLLLTGAPIAPLAEIVREGTHLFVYDVNGGDDVNPANIKFRTQYGVIARVSLEGMQSFDGLGLILSGTERALQLTDNRWGVLGNVAFIATSGWIWSASLLSGVTGYDLNGMTAGGITFAADIDGDGNALDKTAVYAGGLLLKVNIGGNATGDFYLRNGGGFVSGINVAGQMTNADVVLPDGGLGRFQAGAWDTGRMTADYVRSFTVGGKGTLSTGNLANVTVNLAGPSLIGRVLNNLSVSGRVSNSLITVTGPVGGVAVNIWGAGAILAVGVDPGFDGLYFTGDDVATEGGVKSLQIAAHETVAPADFGVIAGSVGSVRFGKTTLLKTQIPFTDGRFRIVKV